MNYAIHLKKWRKTFRNTRDVKEIFWTGRRLFLRRKKNKSRCVLYVSVSPAQGLYKNSQIFLSKDQLNKESPFTPRGIQFLAKFVFSPLPFRIFRWYSPYIFHRSVKIFLANQLKASLLILLNVIKSPKWNFFHFQCCSLELSPQCILIYDLSTNSN